MQNIFDNIGRISDCHLLLPLVEIARGPNSGLNVRDEKKKHKLENISFEFLPILPLEKQKR